MFPAVAINSVLAAAANTLYLLDLEAICPNIRFSCEGGPNAVYCQIHLPVPLGQRRNEAIPGENWYWACS